MKKLCLIAIVFALAGCEPPPTLAEYRPIVDPGRTNSAAFERDLVSCRNVATQAEAAYKERQQKEMGANILAGVLVGAIAGAAIGDSSNWAAYGAASGAAAGAAATDTELAQGGPRRIVDRCMVERGHRVLNDLGKG